MNLKRLKGKEVCVEWIDAVGEMKERLEKLKDIPPQSLLIVTKTYGLLYNFDDKALVILTEVSDEECDYTAIPTSWIISISEMRVKGGKNDKR